MRRGPAASLAVALLTSTVPSGHETVTLDAASPVSPPPRVTFVAPPGESILVHGTYPPRESECATTVQPILHTRHAGTLEVGKASDGTLFVIGVLPFEDYVKGIAEVPRTWPMAALQAQAVAARTYALAHMDDADPVGDAFGYQICATTACQVYRGLGVTEGPYGDRWRTAVEETAGEVLVHDGSPADTLYFSTSNGQTFGNEVIFGGAPLPYLRPVAEADDGDSPLTHWRVHVPLADVATFLRRAGRWSDGPVATVRRNGPNIVMSGGGLSKTLHVQDFRGAINAWGPCLDPGRYPPDNAVTELGLPQTIPSRWFAMSTIGTSVVLEGRGWGHGVGMVQWGAYGKASRGLGYADILAAYYGGLRPVAHDVPGIIRVAIATGLTSVRVAGTGGASVHGRNPGPGPWLVTGGSALKVVHAAPPPAYIEAGTIDVAPAQAPAGATVSATVTLPQLSVARLVLRVHGQDLPISDPRTFPAGPATIEAVVPTLTTGTYDLQGIVTDGNDIVRTAARAIRVIRVAPGPGPTPSPAPSVTPTPPAPPPSPSATAVSAPPQGSDRDLAVPIALGAIAAAWGLGMALGLVRRRRTRSGPTDPVDPG